MAGLQVLLAFAETARHASFARAARGTGPVAFRRREERRPAGGRPRRPPASSHDAQGRADPRRPRTAPALPHNRRRVRGSARRRCRRARRAERDAAHRRTHYVRQARRRAQTGRAGAQASGHRARRQLLEPLCRHRERWPRRGDPHRAPGGFDAGGAAHRRAEARRGRSIALPAHARRAFASVAAGCTRVHGLSTSHHGSPAPWQFVEGRRRVEWTPDAPVVMNDGEGWVAAAAEGPGLVRVPDYLAAAEVRAGRLRTVLERLQPPPLPISVVHPSARRTTPRLRALLDSLDTAA